MICLRNALCVLAAFVSYAPLAVFAAITNPTPQRSYVSIHGVDGNTCGAAAPCRTWQYAMDNETQPGGEVLTIDSGGFGTLNITKDITIVVPPGVYGGMSPPSGADGVVINGAGINVVLRGLTINSQVSGGTNHGIYMTNGASLTIDRCTVSSFGAVNFSGDIGGAGIYVNAPASVTITDTVVKDNYVGMRFGGGALVQISQSRAVGNYIGFAAMGGYGDTALTVVSVSDSLATASGGTGGVGYYSSGTYACGTSCHSNMTVTNSIASHNTYNILGISANATMTLSRSRVTDGGVGLLNNGGTFNSTGDNVVVGNTTPTSGTITNISASALY